MANAIALCPRCHRFGPKSWHNDPIGAADWFAKKFPARAEYLRQAILDRQWRTEELESHLEFLTQKLSELDS